VRAGQQLHLWQWAQRWERERLGLIARNMQFLRSRKVLGLRNRELIRANGELTCPRWKRLSIEGKLHLAGVGGSDQGAVPAKPGQGEPAEHKQHAGDGTTHTSTAQQATALVEAGGKHVEVDGVRAKLKLGG
jgi:hypothetical protein